MTLVLQCYLVRKLLVGVGPGLLALRGWTGSYMPDLVSTRFQGPMPFAVDMELLSAPRMASVSSTTVTEEVRPARLTAPGDDNVCQYQPVSGVY